MPAVENYDMDRNDILAEEQQDLLEKLVALVSRQTRLLEEIRDLLAAESTPRRRTPATRSSRSADYD
jgi:hypothetical protein